LSASPIWPSSPATSPVARRARDHDGDPEDHEDVERADSRGSEEAREQQDRAPDGPDDERLQQPALRVAADDAEGEEDGQDDAEEQRREHGQAQHRRADDRPRVDDLAGRPDVVEVVEELARAEPVQDEEADREQEDDRERLSAERLLEAVADDRRDRSHGRSSDVPACRPVISDGRTGRARAS
jgi:hypothetical protein